MALDLVEIRMILSGAKKLVAEADAASGAIAGTGKAAKTANEEAALSGKKATGSLAATATKLRSINSGMRALGSGLTKYATLPILAVGAASVDMGLKFEKSVLLLHTQTGVAKSELGGLRRELLSISRDTIASPTEVSAEAYRLAGAGLRGGKLREATRASTQLAMVGEANPEETAKTLGQVWYSEIAGSANFKHDVAELNATVGAGDLRLSQLVDALGTGVPKAAAQAGLNLHEVNAVMAVFGDTTNNVSGFAAQFATGLHYFTAPGDKAKSALADMGLGAYKLSRDLGKPNGLVRMLADLREHLEKLPGGIKGTQAKKLLAEVLPGGRGRVFGAVLLESIGKLKEKLGDITARTKDWKNALRETEENPQIKLQKAWNDLKVTLTEVGLALIPILIPALEKVSEGIQAVAKWFENLSPAGKKTVFIIAGIVAVIGPLLMILSLLLPALEAVGAVLLFLISPVGLVIVAIVALAAGFYYAYTHVKWFHDAVDAVFGFVKSHWKLLIIPFYPIIGPLIIIVTHLSNVRDAIHWVITAAENVVKWFQTSAMGQALIAPFKAMVEYVKGAISVIETVVEVAEGALEIAGGEGIGPGAQFTPKQEAEHHERHAQKHPPAAPWATSPGLAPPAQSRVLRRHHRDTAWTGTGGSRPAPRRDRDIYVTSQLVLPDGRVLAEETKKAEDDAKARL